MATLPLNSPELPPLLHGDGVADDTEAVQWYLDHGYDLPSPPEGGSYSVWLDVLRFPLNGGGYVIAK
jgi:hypothetical protein